MVNGEQKPKEQKLMQRVHLDPKSCGPKFKTADLKVPLHMLRHQGSGSEELSHTEQSLTTHLAMPGAEAPLWASKALKPPSCTSWTPTSETLGH